MKSESCGNNHPLKQAAKQLVSDDMFASCQRHGNMECSVRDLLVMALFWAWGQEPALKHRFQAGRAALAQLVPQARFGASYQGFIKLLKRWSPRLLTVFVRRLRERTRQVAGDDWTIGGWPVMAVDGTRVEVPRTKKNEDWFSRVPSQRRRTRPKRQQRTGKGKSQKHPPAPQTWLTVMWHVGVGLLWDWRQGPTGSSERDHLLEMLDDLPDSTLLVADAGFQGYDYWQALLERGHSFLIRVGGNVRLLRGLGHCRGRGNIVALWPDKARRRQQPPLLLRLAEFRGGRQTVWLVTNVLDRRQLSTCQMRTIYRQRWGVELFFRGLKQTFGRSKLRSQSPRNAEVELDWSLAALWSLELLGKRELLQRGAGPHDLSLAGALRAIRVALQCASQGVETELFSQLAAHRDDGYVRRQKAIRKWPKRKSEPRIRPPQVVAASQEQLQDSKRLPSHAVSKSFTA